MFANLKKKIEEEVGDLDHLSSPLTSFGNLERGHSGSSTQETNTPGLGSRESSVTSLIDTVVDHRSNRQYSAPPGPILTPISKHNNFPHELNNDRAHANEIKKLNQEWHRKVEKLKKSYEEKIQTQELDFAWMYNSKDEEIVKLRGEKKRFEDQIKAMTQRDEEYHRKQLERVQEEVNVITELKIKSSMNDLQNALANKEGELEEQNKVNENLAMEKQELSVYTSKVEAKVDEMERELSFAKLAQKDLRLKMERDKEKTEIKVLLLTESIKELKMQVEEKKLNLELAHQQLQELRKSLSKELKGSSKSGSVSNNCSASLDDISLSDENQLTQLFHSNGTINRNDTDNGTDNHFSQSISLPPLFEPEVNFQYIRSVVFKYLTSRDPLVTQHMTRVMGTLLHLSEEELQLLSQCNESRVKSWTYGSLLFKS